MTEKDIQSLGSFAEMKPGLKMEHDQKALWQGINRGMVDVIATDHAPHTENEKDIEFERSEFGVIGLETELSAAITELVGNRILDWAGIVRRMSLNPAKILGIDRGTLSEGAVADIVIVDPEKEWRVIKEEFVSKSRNCAFLGKKLKGVVEYTICAGKVVYASASTDKEHYRA
jgi:dihydroorotase